MELNEIVQTLKQTYSNPLSDHQKRRIIFWLDKDQEFLDVIEEMEIPDVTVHRLTEKNSFQTKYLLEEEDASTNYLIYTTEELLTEDNWLIDTYLYSQSFYADKVSIIMRDIGIDHSLRAIVKKYKKFFGSKERVRKLKAFGITQFTEETFEIALMSVLCNVKTPNFEDVLKAVLMDTMDEEENKFIIEMEKFLDVMAFWKYVSKYYGFEQSNPSLKKLMTHLTVTTLSHSVKEEHLLNVKDYIAHSNRTNSLVFIDRWMHHKDNSASYDALVRQIEKDINLRDIVQQMNIDEFKKDDVFPYFDQAIIQYIYNGLKSQHEDYEEYKSLIRLRRAKHFYPEYQYFYEALYNAVDMYAFKKEYPMGIPKQSMKDMHKSYIDHYYIMDTLYRRFYNAFDQAEQDDRLNELQRLIEYVYTNWFMSELNTNWSSSIQEEIKGEWAIDGVVKQQDFYQNFVSSKVRNGDRVFVIISDALRYDIGVEVAEYLNAETMGSSQIESMLSVLPSVTKLGMASLLPHRTLKFDSNQNVIVDGKASQGTTERKKILQDAVKESTAISFKELDTMSKNDRRQYFKGKKVNYIYHNSIDATGDHASTERNTFNAVDKAIEEIYKIVKIISDELSGTNIYITADHGFIYQRNPLEESDKIEKVDFTINEMKSRYILSDDQETVDELLRIPLKGIIANQQECYVPKSTIRFKMKGQGVNFVHGGASLQEVVVPLITFKNARKGQARSRETQQVDIKLTNTARKLTNSIFQLNFFQTEKVEGKMTPRTANIFMVDEQEQKISNEEVVIADKMTDKPEERMFKLRFVLKTQDYDKNKTYYLIVKDMNTGVVLERIPFTISLGISNEFDF
ncbi:BREX-1 system phosphatase PglZ type A [Salinicoccus siamensis]|uniref:BREX-1 system phosphatase PglZ type A n=1 Tax=Salinicoccus siamensis TaxID=381830 RepID=A0ABV5Z0J6_9STAP